MKRRAHQKASQANASSVLLPAASLPDPSMLSPQMIEAGRQISVASTTACPGSLMVPRPGGISESQVFLVASYI